MTCLIQKGEEKSSVFKAAKITFKASRNEKDQTSLMSLLLGNIIFLRWPKKEQTLGVKLN